MYESAGDELILRNASILFANPAKSLPAVFSGGDDHDAAVCQLLDERARNRRSGCRDHDSVERCARRISERTVPGADCDVGCSERVEDLACRLCERLDSFNGNDLSRQAREDRRLISGSGSDLEHAVLRMHVQVFRHIGDDIGLAYGLTLEEG